MVFDKSCYPPYTNRKALDQKSFPMTDAETYIFQSADAGAESPKKKKKKQKNSSGVSLPTIGAANIELSEDEMELSQLLSRATASHCHTVLLKVTPRMIDMLRQSIDQNA